jgi:hypothetical protein
MGRGAQVTRSAELEFHYGDGREPGGDAVQSMMIIFPVFAGARAYSEDQEIIELEPR